MTEEIVRLKLFQFSLKDKAKNWLHSLKPATIRSWQEMTREFLKKLFPTHKTNTLRWNIMNFSQKKNETFFSVGNGSRNSFCLVHIMDMRHDGLLASFMMT